MTITPTQVIGAALVLAALLFFRDALRLSLSRPGRRFTSVHPWERWLHAAKPVAVAAWLWVVGATDLDRPLLAGLPPGLASGLRWAGAGVALPGIAFACWAKITLGAQFASRAALHEGHVLVTTGPYQVTRHPIYTGALMALWGLVLASDSLAGLIVWGGFFTWMAWMHTIAEEQLLAQRFGDLYRAYRDEVPRLLPRIRGGASRLEG